MSFAQLPSWWLSSIEGPDDKRRHTLAELHWRDHRAAGICALLILIMLATRLNNVNRVARKSGKPDTDTVAVTWTELQEATGHARATVGKGIMLLESWDVLKVKKVGRANHYQLVRVHEPGDWCALPLTFPEKDGDAVSRFRNLPSTQLGLNALKLYVVLLARRSHSYNTTALSFNGIVRWTGIRREDIRKAWGFLDGQQLATVSTMRDTRHSKFGDDDQSQRYAIIGLTRGYTKQDLDWAAMEKRREEELYQAGMPGKAPASEPNSATDNDSYSQHL